MTPTGLSIFQSTTLAFRLSPNLAPDLDPLLDLIIRTKHYGEEIKPLSPRPLVPQFIGRHTNQWPEKTRSWIIALFPDTKNSEYSHKYLLQRHNGSTYSRHSAMSFACSSVFREGHQISYRGRKMDGLMEDWWWLGFAVEGNYPSLEERKKCLLSSSFLYMTEIN